MKKILQTIKKDPTTYLLLTWIIVGTLYVAFIWTAWLAMPNVFNQMMNSKVQYIFPISTLIIFGFVVYWDILRIKFKKNS